MRAATDAGGAPRGGGGRGGPLLSSRFPLRHPGQSAPLIASKGARQSCAAQQSLFDIRPCLVHCMVGASECQQAARGHSLLKEGIRKLNHTAGNL